MESEKRIASIDKELAELAARRQSLVQRLSVLQSTVPPSQSSVPPYFVDTGSKPNKVGLGLDGKDKNMLAIIAAALMAAAAFLPWAESTGQFLGQSETISANALESGIGYGILLFAAAGGALGFIKNRLAFVCGIINLLIGLSGLMLGRTNVSYGGGVASASGGFGLGVIVLIIASIVFIVVTLKHLRKS